MMLNRLEINSKGTERKKEYITQAAIIFKLTSHNQLNDKQVHNKSGIKFITKTIDIDHFCFLIAEFTYIKGANAVPITMLNSSNALIENNSTDIEYINHTFPLFILVILAYKCLKHF